ncbi:ATP synthase subunit C lysine N-methyltransferase isoform X4 [Triplophysa dalaica]|uniref:ATP synthase subunit C lysine N-methyltransferase isoform X4 n=1 Tax=Triplophysa dalaica TaxID=1582913 RepID=UPI0024DFEA1F|nr:ATP synthase subunit C lysine N-methyltransferase isoform X4 [Triplophysa dalaica]
MSPFPRTKLTLYAQKYFMMEDSIEMFLQDENCKLSNPAQEKPVVTAASGALLMGFYGLWTLFALPGFRKVPVCLKVPYLPSSRTQTQNVMKLLHGRAGSLADLGSGDGRLVFAAAVAGFECTGFEINSILNGYARVKGMWKGIPPSTASFINQDYWKTNLSKYNNVTVFLAPGVRPIRALQMEVLGRKLEMELSDEARVIACRFPFPDWTPTAIEGEGLDQTWAYDMRTIQKLSSQPATK